MTNADKIRAMDDNALQRFLVNLTYDGYTPWSKPFRHAFCNNCPSVEHTMQDGAKVILSECDLSGECPHGSEIAWWLRQEADHQQ
jgi:hypothetical protein